MTGPTSTPETFSGGCQCGAVRYQLLERPTNAHLCHCRMCQKQFGNFFAALAGVPKSKFRVSRGEMANFRSSATVQRGFCRDCGTPLTYEPLDADAIAVGIGTLDRHSEFKPEAQYGLEAREPWFNEVFELPVFVSGEDASGVSDFAAKLPGIAATNRQHPDHDTVQWPVQASDPPC